ncbi:MAG: type II toxin-antitoxin system VapC family toxin [Chitinophagaceae bacterium]|nr:type II toxin-antitoxin system VapC family toxin [Anaerolineae bacterium]
MKVLLDTQAFLWWDEAPEKISANASVIFQNQANTFLLSFASIWEMQIKVQLGKMHLRLPLEKLIEDQKQNTGLVLLPINLAHIFHLDMLPFHHKDPFDRLLIAQAVIEDIPIMSSDAMLANYKVQIIW